MKRATTVQSDLGLALLEMAVLSIGLFLLVLGGFIASDRFNHFSYAKQMVDRYVHDEAVAPLHLVSSASGFSIEVDSPELESFISQMMANASSEIQGIISRHSLIDSYKIDMGYQVLEIGSTDGTVVNVQSLQCFSQSSGQSVSAGSECPELQEGFQALAEQETSTGRSLYAVPTAYLGRKVDGGGDQESQQFFPFAVLLGMRIEWSVERQDGDVGITFGLPDRVSDKKVTVLRGELAL